MKNVMILGEVTQDDIETLIRVDTQGHQELIVLSDNQKKIAEKIFLSASVDEAANGEPTLGKNSGLPTLGNPNYICKADCGLAELFEDEDNSYLPDENLYYEGIYIAAMDLDRPLVYPNDYYFFLSNEEEKRPLKYLGIR